MTGKPEQPGQENENVTVQVRYKSRGRGAVEKLRTSGSPVKAMSASSRPKRGSESPEKGDQPEQQRPRVSRELGFDVNFDLLQLRPLSGPPTYRAMTDLDTDWQDSLEAWWRYYQTKNKGDFRRWWTGFRDGTKCCGCKVVTRKDSECSNCRGCHIMHMRPKLCPKRYV